MMHLKPDMKKRLLQFQKEQETTSDDAQASELKACVV